MTSASQDGTYPPLDALKEVVDGVWVVDSGPLRVLGMPVPVRMTIVRLANGDLWLHSPTRFSASLRSEVEAVGRIAHLVAPDVAHWSFLEEWQRNVPAAKTWAAPGLRERTQVRRSGVRLDEDLSETAPQAWAGEIDQVVVRGLGFSEVDFFHRPSRTLILTDLVQNLETERLPLHARLLARVAGVAAPDGKTPVYLRWALRAKKRDAARAAGQLLAWRPERVVLSHGRWYDRDGTEALRRSLRWLTG